MASEPSEADVRMRAYWRFLQRGGTHGMDFDDWLDAEGGLKTKARIMQVRLRWALVALAAVAFLLLAVPRRRGALQSHAPRGRPAHTN